jgi:hypothetical protein
MKQGRALIYSCLMGVFLAVYYYLRLPAEIAVHFGANGRGDSLGGSEFYLFLNTGLHVSLTMLFLLIPKYLHKMPPSLLNLPNKSYWLKTENLEEARRLLNRLMSMFGASVNLYLILAGYLSYRANLVTPPRLDVTVFLLITFLFVVWSIIWTVMLFKEFKIPPKGGASSRL